MSAVTKRIIDIRVLHGEPTDGSGRVCIHLFVPDSTRWSFVEPCALHMIDKRLVSAPTKGRLACDPSGTRPMRLKNQLAGKPVVTIVTPRTDDPRAVTCPRCAASPEYAITMKLITAAEAGK